MLKSKSRCWVEVDIDKVKKNYKTIDKHIGKTKIMAVVKANAYGHGDVVVAKALQDLGVDFFAVSSVDEAVELRSNGIQERILILGYTPNEHFHYLHELEITQCIMSLEYAQALNKYCEEHKCSIQAHVKVDTGMSRLGIPCIDANNQIDDVIAVYALEFLEVCGIFSHFSVADTFENPMDAAYTDHQIELFDKALATLKEQGIDYGITHLQNSYGCLNYPELTYDYARPGIILLGNASDDHIALKHPTDLEPSLEWKANVSLVKVVKKGTFISYGRNYQAKEDMLVATVSCGYADGINRQASNKFHEVLVDGKRCPIIGNICMDQFLVDVSKVAQVRSGDTVTIVGSDGSEYIAIDELSRSANTINNESFCLISRRVPRFYKHRGEKDE